MILEGEIGALAANIDDLFHEIARGHEQRDLIARELSHRIKNTFATVIAIAIATFRKADPAADAG